MSIASEITRLQTAKSDLATSIANKGVTVPANATLDDYAALVDSIQTGGGGSTLPYDAEVEYLESTGTQYINTGVYPSTSLTFEMEFTLVNGFTLGGTSFLFGEYTDDCIYSVAVPSLNAIRVPSRTGFENATTSLNYTSSHTLSYTPGSIYMDGTKIGTQARTISSTGVPIRLYGRNSNVDANKTVTSKMRIHRVLMSKDGSVIQSLAPVRVGQVGYMYDKVSGQLLGNAGTGSFILGNDIV